MNERRNMGPRFVSGFTLLELFATMAIIATLASVLVPVFGRAKDRGRAARCCANLRQWGMAIQMYADDNGECLPRRGQGVQSLSIITRGSDWFNALPPYLRNPSLEGLVAAGIRLSPRDQSVFICPDAVDPGGAYFLCYGMNMNLSPWILPVPTRVSEVVRPDAVVALAESPGPYASTYPSKQAYGVVARHVQRGNLLFLGGQVRSCKASYIGCGVGDPGQEDVRWITGTPSDGQSHNY